MIGPWARFRQIRGFSEERDSAPYSAFQTGRLVSALNNLEINDRLLVGVVYKRKFRIGEVSDLLLTLRFAGTAFASAARFCSPALLNN